MALELRVRIVQGTMVEISRGTLSGASLPEGRSRRRILVCTPFAPRLDARHGGKPTAQLLRRLAEQNEVALLALRLDRDDRVDPAIGERCSYVEEVRPPSRSPLRRRIAWAVGLVRGLPPWAIDCRSYVVAPARRNLPRTLGPS